MTADERRAHAVPPVTTPIADLRVLEISDRIAGGYCGKILRDFGASVAKVEPPEGDPVRRYSASVRPRDTDGRGTPLSQYLHAGKRSVTAAPGSKEVADLVAGADVVILTATADQARTSGLDVARLLAPESGLAAISISEFGWTGPWAQRAATEFTLQGWCGSSGGRGSPDGPPWSVAGDVGEYVAGSLAAVAALAIVRRVRAGGPGDHIDLSMLEAMTLQMQSCEWLHKHLIGLPPTTRSIEVPSIEQAMDGYVGVSMITGQQWADFCTMTGCDDLAEMPELRMQLGRWAHRDMIATRIGPWMRGHTVAEIVELGELFRIPVAPLGNGATIRDMTHLRERNAFRVNADGIEEPRPPWRMSLSRHAPAARAPAVGEDNGTLRWAPRTRSVDRTVVRLPLDGVRIIDLTAFFAGPSATNHLAVLGADVIKIESIQRPDGIRYSGGHRTDVEDWWEYGWVFQAFNTNKRSVTLDLGSADGIGLIKQMITSADAVIENFSPRVMDQFGLGVEALLELNPRLVVVRMPAFGLDGPWRDRVGFAMTMEQITGMAWITGPPEGAPTPPRGVCDPLAGSHGAAALLAALEFTQRTGQGQWVEMAMVESVLNVTAIQILEAQAFGAVMGREGNRSHGITTQNTYRCAGEDSWVSVAICDNDQWSALITLMGAPAWAADDDLATPEQRRQQAGAIDSQLAEWFAAQNADEVTEQLAAAGVPAAPVVSPSEVTGNIQLRDRGFFEELTHPSSGPGLYPRPPYPPIRGAAGRWLRTPAPTLGQDTRHVLAELCGLGDDEWQRLVREQVVGTRPKGS